MTTVLSDRDAAETQSRVSRWVLIVALHAIVFVLLAWWSWRRWPDLLVDFGRELYVPWQITRGRVLYRDVASLFGPLSPYLNALWFTLFGTSLLTLVVCNLAILAATVTGIYYLVRTSTDRFTASTASLVTLLLFGFSQYVAIGNYNFVTPYSHEATHGVALSVACLLCVQHGIVTARRTWWSAAGAAFGLVLLTKPETSVAAGAGVSAAFAAGAAISSLNKQELLRGVPLFILSAAIAPLSFFSYFAARMEPAAALWATAGAWTPLLGGSGIHESAFYVRGMGLDHPLSSAAETFLTFVVLLGIVVAAAAAARTSADPARSAPAAGRLGRAVVLVAAILLLQFGTFPRALPLISLTALAAFVVLFSRVRQDRDSAVRVIPLISWSVFALFLLVKLGLNARIVHYGFYLAMPATVVAIVAACWLIPNLLAKRHSEAAARSFRRMTLWILAGAIVPYLGLSNAWYRTKTIPIGGGADVFYASTSPGFQRGQAVREALNHLQQSLPPGATLAVLPEGVMLNYLLRRDSPLRVITVMPPELMMYGENEILRSLAAAPPDFVLLVQKDTSEYGYPLFGTDARYGLRTVTWIRNRYRQVRVIGQDPLTSRGFGIAIFGPQQEEQP